LSYCPRSSLPADVLVWLTGRLRRLLPPRPPGMGGNPPLALEVRLDAVAAVILDGLSYRRAGRMVGISKTEVGDSMDLLLGKLAALGFCQPDGTFVATLAELCERLGEMARSGEAVVVDGLATRVQRPSAWVNQKVLYDAKRHTHTAQGLAVSTIHGDLLWCDGGWPGSCHEQELKRLAHYRDVRPDRPQGSRGLGNAQASLIELSGLGDVLDAGGVVTLLDRGFRGMAKRREHWHAPVGDRRTKDRLSDGQRAFNRLQAGLRALVEQAIGHLANAWSLRRWRGLLYRVRDVFRAAGALVCLGRWLQRIPRDRASAGGG
jgi:DDE superfamily endonuclease